jgi:hypothetical protein
VFTVPSGRLPDHFMPWIHPFTSVIPGSTGSGQSVCVRKFVHNIQHMMMPSPDKIWWCYDVHQPLYGTVDGVEFVHGLPDLDVLDPAVKHLIIIDDQMDDVDKKVANLITKYLPLRNLSVMLIVHNLFSRNKYHRTVNLNTHYMVLFKNPRDTSQIMGLAHQMDPRKTPFFLEAFSRATARFHGYMAIDMKQDIPYIL